MMTDIICHHTKDYQEIFVFCFQPSFEYMVYQTHVLIAISRYYWSQIFHT